jgi:hypothetical protein
MIKLFLSGLVLGFLMLNPAAVSAKLSKGEYKTAKDGIDAAYKSDKAACDPLSGNAKDICMAEAKGKRKVAKAELDARDKNTRKARQAAREARADADYQVAKEKCDDKTGNDKQICVKAAKAARTAAMADAKADRKTAEAREDAGKTVSKARTKEAERVTEARKDAAEDKRDADYAVAKEKCDKFAGEAKTRCLDDAKARYSKK